MAHEILVGVQVADDAGYQRYRERMTPILERYGGSFGYDFRVSEVLRSRTPEPINRVFILSFPDVARRHAFFADESYAAIKEDHFESSVQAATILAEYDLAGGTRAPLEQTRSGALIRPAREADKETVANLQSAMLDDMAGHGGFPVASLDDRRRYFRELFQVELAKAEAQVLVAEREGDRVGAASAKIVEQPPVFVAQRTLHVSTLYVAPAHRRLGIAQDLLLALFQWGREQSCTSADLNVLAGNPARLLYQRLGFRELQQKLVVEL